MSTGLTNTHTARGFSDLYHVFTRKQCILCPALLHGCLTLLYVTSTRDFFYPGTIAQIVLTKYIQCWATVLCNNHSNYRSSIEKRPCEISCKEQWLLLYRNTLQHWRECLPPVECYKTVFRLNGLDLNGDFEDCKSENTRANHPYEMQTKSAKVNSLKYSFCVKIIKD